MRVVQISSTFGSGSGGTAFANTDARRTVRVSAVVTAVVVQTAPVSRSVRLLQPGWRVALSQMPLATPPLLSPCRLVPRSMAKLLPQMLTAAPAATAPGAAVCAAWLVTAPAPLSNPQKLDMRTSGSITDMA